MEHARVTANSTLEETLANAKEDESLQTYDDESFATLDGSKAMDADELDKGNNTAEGTEQDNSTSEDKGVPRRAKDPDLLLKPIDQTEYARSGQTFSSTRRQPIC